jgi:hypothetical protein
MGEGEERAERKEWRSGKREIEHKSGQVLNI